MLKRILVGVIFVPLIVLLVVLGPSWAFALFVAFITAVAAWELLHAMAKLPLRQYLYTCAAAAILPLGFWAGTETGVKTLGFAALALFVLQFVEAIQAYDSDRATPYEVVLKSLFAGIIMPGFLTSLVILMGYGEEGHGRMYVLMTIGLCFITDGGAYFAGVLCGKHRGITRVSPNKSLEGYLGGLVVGALFMVIYGLVLRQAFGMGVHLPLMALYGLLGALVTEIGDLSFSLIKRESGIKDYGKLLPGHGGMMDRFDSMVFCAPMIMLLSQCAAPF
jgi:phosphatidate cytidylyltransferase